MYCSAPALPRIWHKLQVSVTFYAYHAVIVLFAASIPCNLEWPRGHSVKGLTCGGDVSLDAVKPQEARPQYRDEERNRADACHVVSATSGS